MKRATACRSTGETPRLSQAVDRASHPGDAVVNEAGRQPDGPIAVRTL